MCKSIPKFQFKIFVKGADPLRKDKVIFYTKNDYSFKFLYRMLITLKDFFHPVTPSLTKELFPGLGFAKEPTTEEIRNLKEFRDKEAILTSFEEWMIKKIGEHLFDLSKKYKPTIQKALITLQQDLNNPLKIQEAHEMLKNFFNELSYLVIQDSTVINFIQKVDEAHSELLNLTPP
jgi:hypothetical protein